jgi:inosine/xanthosine triphosphatase
MKTIVLGSTSEHKVNAVKNAIDRIRLYGSLSVATATVDSGVPEQPLGFDEIRAGAFARASRALLACESADYAVGVENGLVYIGTGYIDIAVVCLLDRDDVNGSIYTTSAGLPCPLDYVFQSFRTNREKTAGAFCSEATGCDPSDWTGYFTGGVFTRGLLLEQPVTMALAIKFIFQRQNRIQSNT